MKIVEAVRAIAQAKSAKPGQIALAWLLAQGPDIVPIPGTKRRSYLEENVAAADLHLSASDLERLEAVAPRQEGGIRRPCCPFLTGNRWRERDAFHSVTVDCEKLWQIEQP